MKNNIVYLKPNVVIEPLVEKWYAWAHLISPATAAMNVTRRHLKIIDSYIQAPEIHTIAVKNPKMLGGPFMDFDKKRVDEVKELKEQTKQNQAELIALSESILELEALLKSHDKGMSLEPLYDKVPERLKGYVELIYDLNNNPSFRFFEHFLYASKYYNTASQSISLWVTQNDERPFCLSTPRLKEDHVLHLDIPFKNEGIDALSKMKRIGNQYDFIKELLGIKEEDESLFKTLFTDEKPPEYQKYTGDKVRMRYFGHACILVETKDVSILVDPLISYYGYDTDVAHFSDIDLPEVIDYILITHNHQDHVLFETLLPLRHKTKNVIVPRTNSGALQDPSLKLMFQNIGFNNVVEVDEMDAVNFEDATITSIPFTGEHSDLNIRAKTCFHVKFGGFSLLFVADSRVMESKIYDHVHQQMGDIDILFLGMECDGAPMTWLYGPLLSDNLPRNKDESRRLSGSDCDKGMSLIDIFNPKEAYVYAMGQEPWVEFISSIKYTNESNPIKQSNELIRKCKQKKMIAERLYGEKELFYDYYKLIEKSEEIPVVDYNLS